MEARTTPKPGYWHTAPTQELHTTMMGSNGEIVGTPSGMEIVPLKRERQRERGNVPFSQGPEPAWYTESPVTATISLYISGT